MIRPNYRTYRVKDYARTVMRLSRLPMKLLSRERQAHEKRISAHRHTTRPERERQESFESALIDAQLTRFYNSHSK